MIVITFIIIATGTIGFYTYDKLLFNILYKKMNISKVAILLNKLMNL